MNDKTLYYASQIAYFKFDERLEDDLKDNLKDNGPITLQQALETYATRLYDDINQEISDLDSKIQELEIKLEMNTKKDI